MPTAATIPCPRCRYDLSTIPGESGTCPECGRPFHKPTIARLTHRLTGLALGSIAIGGLTTSAAGAIGAIITYLPIGKEGSGGDGDSSQAILRALPLTLAAAGFGLLAWIAPGSKPPARRAGVWAAALLPFLALHGATARSWKDWQYAWWLQPQSWKSLADYGMPIALCIAIVITTRTIAARAREVGLDSAAPFLQLVRVAALLTLIAAIARNAHQDYLEIVMRNGGYRYFAPAGSPPGSTAIIFSQSDTSTQSLTYLQAMLRESTWLGLSLIALVVWRMWTAHPHASPQ